MERCRSAASMSSRPGPRGVSIGVIAVVTAQIRVSCGSAADSCGSSPIGSIREGSLFCTLLTSVETALDRWLQGAREAGLDHDSVAALFTVAFQDAFSREESTHGRRR